MMESDSLLKKLLEATGWTQARLAQEMNVTFATLNRWFNGHNTPQASHRLRLGELYREYVGLGRIADAEYQRIVKKADGLRLPGRALQITKNEKMVEELVLLGSYNSNRMEGTLLSLRETQALIEHHQMAPGKPYADHLLISHHATLVRELLCQNKPGFSEEAILNWHKRLFDSLREDAGHYAKFPRRIAGLNILLPHPKDVPEEMERFLKKAMKVPKTGALSWIAESHADFELIHPFGDGNGRIGRLIIMSQCLMAGLPPLIIRETRRAAYYEVLEEAQRREIRHLVVFLNEEMDEVLKILKKRNV